MNEGYYIKAVSAPGLKYMDKKYEVLVEFKTENMRNKFSRCAGFLLYETGNKYDGGMGAKSVFAKGYIKIPKEYESSNEQCSNKNFPFTIKCVIEKVVENYHQGFSADKINKICPGLNFKPMPIRGGLYPINKIQFDTLSSEMSEGWKKLSQSLQ